MNKLNKKGFTLIELIVVMAVIAILVLLAAPRFLGYTKDANVTSMKADTKMLANIALIYNVESDDNTFPIGAVATAGAALEAKLPTWDDDKDGGTTPEVAVPIYVIDNDKIKNEYKSLKNPIADYVMDGEGQVYHVSGVEGRDGTVYFNEVIK